MRVAAIDLGTNTALLTIAEVAAGRAVAVDERAEIVRLGQGLDKTGMLAPAAIERTLAVLVDFAAAVKSYGCTRFVAVATEATRKASNGAAFVAAADRALADAGGKLEVIDGEREARLAWRAVVASFPELTGVRTVVDIGGGSTELLVGEARVESVISLPIGSVRLTERLVAHDPPSADERAQLVATVDAAIAQAAAPRGTLVGIAGTVTTLAAMAQRLTTYDGARVHGSRISRATVEQLVDQLATTPLADKRRTPGLDPKRADVIFAGAVILARVMARAGVADCLVSDRGIRWGLIYEAAANA
ncbi:MAG TPA: Ppx/GppA phosphatase family protein [Polyangia bacterium]|nr:Ppx/GppA phosphatase family protein [Polyangia bacterium]